MPSLFILSWNTQTGLCLCVCLLFIYTKYLYTILCFLELLGTEKGGVCWGSVCVCVCARAPAGSCRRRPAFTPGRGGLYVKEVCF